MNRLILIVVSTVAVFASVGCEHAQRLQWHLPQLEIDSQGFGFYIPFPTVKDDIAYESPFQISTVQETEVINHIEPVWIGSKGYESTVVFEEPVYTLVRDE